VAFEIEQPVDAGPSPVVEPTKPPLLGVLGPGLITGASDDDPSGIATYSQAGAQFGYALTWTMLFTYPLTAVQIVSARMGRTTGRGIAGNLRQHCRPRLLTGIVVLLLIANAINIGADLGAMADASRLVVGGPQILYVLLFAVICIALQIFLQYTRYVSVLKWLTLFLFRLCGMHVHGEGAVVGGRCHSARWPQPPPRPSPEYRYAARVFIAAEQTDPPRPQPIAKPSRAAGVA
jgi:Mn2+/Fe2+ NRAMP family transporter